MLNRSKSNAQHMMFAWADDDANRPFVIKLIRTFLYRNFIAGRLIDLLRDAAKFDDYHSKCNPHIQKQPGQ